MTTLYPVSAPQLPSASIAADPPVERTGFAEPLDGPTGNIPAGTSRLANIGFQAFFGSWTGIETLGTLTITVGALAEGQMADLDIGFFRTDGSSAGNTGGFITPTFNGFTVVPAPGATASVAAGLFTLALVSFRARRR